MLCDEHYIPMQPIARASRRPTLHSRESLFRYLDEQSALEREWLEPKPERTIYMDGVFDLFHVGHLEAINQCAMLGNRVIIGVTGDEDAEGYKRRPIVPEKERVAIVQSLKVVDLVVRAKDCLFGRNSVDFIGVLTPISRFWPGLPVSACRH